MMSDVAGRTDVERAGSQKHEIEEKLFEVEESVKTLCSFFAEDPKTCQVELCSLNLCLIKGFFEF